MKKARGLYTVIGLALGAVAGSSFDAISIGICLGLLAGVLIDVALYANSRAAGHKRPE
jgi:hypothetical protein